MATAIHLKSESGDDYLKIFREGVTVEGIVKDCQEYYDEEFGYMYVEQVVTLCETIDVEILELALHAAIEKVGRS